jgi:hypothetical protein
MKISFSPQNKPIYPELRIIYRIVQVLLVLKICSRGQKSSLIRLHLFNWGLSSKENRTTLLKFAQQTTTSINFWSIDPMLNRAIEFAVADNLIERDTNNYSITVKGLSYINSISSVDEIEKDINFLKLIGKNITELSVSKQLDLWR